MLQYISYRFTTDHMFQTRRNNAGVKMYIDELTISSRFFGN